MDISFKTKEHTESVTVQYDLPEGHEALVAKFGAETVASAARGAFVIALQAFGRRHIEKGQAEIQTLIANWNPNERAPAVKQTALEKATSALSKMTPEEKKELLNKLRAG